MSEATAARFAAFRTPTAIALGIAALLGYAYALTLDLRPYAGSHVLKAMPVVILLGIALVKARGLDRFAMLLGYIGAAAGDVLLDRDRSGFLLYALVCFLVWQLAFSAVFVGRMRLMKARLPYVLGLIAVAVTVLVLAWKNIEPMRMPVLVYVVALVFMASTALMVPDSPLVGLGAVLFVIADAMIGVSAFIAPFAHSEKIIVATYVTAQVLIGAGLLLRRTAPEERELMPAHGGSPA
jgi:alkenylglycerophosphocholine hydrolase